MAGDVTDCNGFRNFETWTVALWLGNERSDYEHWRAEAIRCWTEAQFASAVIENRWSREEETELHLSSCIAGAVRAAAEEVGNGLLRDLLTEALSSVAWHEVAAHFLAEIEDFGSSENLE
ncbi:MAG: hypothetical protein ACK58H_00205 [Planctomyces sp.]